MNDFTDSMPAEDERPGIGRDALMAIGMTLFSFICACVIVLFTAHPL